jgi:hypothetical protein
MVPMGPPSLRQAVRSLIHETVRGTATVIEKLGEAVSKIVEKRAAAKV